MDDKIVVLVDYQEAFPSAHDWGTTEAVLRELRAARQRNVPIVLVEFVGGGRIFDEVLEAVEGYDKVTVVQKRQKDGSAKVLDACNAQLWEISGFRVFGVSTTACVEATAVSLSTKYGALVDVVRDACNSPDLPDTDVWSGFRGHDGLRLV